MVDTCHATFVKLEDELSEAETEATWEGRLAMVASNASEGEQEAFVISKYDLLPESLADIVQVSLACVFDSSNKLYAIVVPFFVFWRCRLVILSFF